VPQGSKAFPFTAQLGITLKPKKRAQIAVLIAPTAYIPEMLPCPALTEMGLCGIHDDKPLRCRTMPFYPYREESEQADMLRPRRGWLCDTSVTAPLVYQNKRIIERADFGREREALMQQVLTMRQYADYMLKYSPWIVDHLAAQAIKPGGNVITSLSSFLTAIKHLDANKIATQQLPVLTAFAEKTAKIPELVDYHRNYLGWAKEMGYLAKRAVR
jgi:Fe-S-cluster containining protein